MKTNLVSVSVLKERLINDHRSLDNPLFEESIYLIDLNLNGKSKKELVKEIKKMLEIVELSYENEYGEEIQWKIYKIIDIFDSVYDIEATNLPNEVYSRHIELPKNAEYQDILPRYFSDYVWEDDL